MEMFLRLAYKLFGCGLVLVNSRGENHASVHLKSLPCGSSQGSAIVRAKIMFPLALETVQIGKDGEPKRVQPPDPSDRRRCHPQPDPIGRVVG